MTTKIAQFEVTLTRVLDYHGELCASPPSFIEDKSVLLDLYQSMVLARTFDKKAIALQRTGKMGTYAPTHGQEAISTATGHAMRTEDVLIPYYRDYAAQLMRGVKMSEILAYWGGDERGSQFTGNTEDLPICVPIASQCLHATGVAFAFKYRNEQRVAVACVGEGGTSEGDFYEAINVAGTWKLPVVFVVNNNQWAISVPLEKQTAAATIAQKAIAAGIEGQQVDGNDVIATRQIIGTAIEKARCGGGSTVIEAITYRLSDHTTADDATRYQPKAQVEQAIQNEPVRRLKTYLQNNGFWSEEEENALQNQCTTKVEQAVHDYLSRKPQPVSSMFDYHFAELPEYLIEQRAIAMEEATNA